MVEFLDNYNPHKKAEIEKFVSNSYSLVSKQTQRNGTDLNDHRHAYQAIADVKQLKNGFCLMLGVEFYMLLIHLRLGTLRLGYRGCNVVSPLNVINLYHLVMVFFILSDKYIIGEKNAPFDHKKKGPRYLKKRPQIIGK